MFQKEFEDRVQANLEVALSRACEGLGILKENHPARAFVANKLIECAHAGESTLSGLTKAGLNAASEYLKASAKDA